MTVVLIDIGSVMIATASLAEAITLRIVLDAELIVLGLLVNAKSRNGLLSQILEDPSNSFNDTGRLYNHMKSLDALILGTFYCTVELNLIF